MAGHLIGWLDHAGHDIATASTGADAMARFADWHPHAVILDSAFDDADAVELCHDIRARSTIPLLFLANQPDVTQRLRAFDSGADDYVSLDIDPPELGARLAAALRRSRTAPGAVGVDGVLNVGALRLDIARHEAFRSDEPLDLTPTEFSVLATLMGHPGQVVARSAILDTIWGVESAPSSNVVDRHIRTLRKKLGDGGHLRRPSRYIETVSRVGYRLRADVPHAVEGKSTEAAGP